MNSNISPNYYYSPSVFEDEQNSIYKSQWIFVGFTTQLSRNNDFITSTIAGIPIVIQNVKGTIKAFLNVCSHRFAILQKEKSGNRPLICPYHGWSYNENGIPTGIPKKPLFQEFTQEELCSMRLKEFRISFCGTLCFISINDNVDALENYLGDFFDEIKLISENCANLVDVNELSIRANWKVIIENTLESYHVGMIHNDTFRKLGARGLNFSFSGVHSCWNADLTNSREHPLNKKIETMFAHRSYFINGYKHFLVFPNLLISTTYGTSYNFSVISPLDSNSSEFKSYVFTAPFDELNTRNSFFQAYAQTLLEFNREVFTEDKVICEEVQKGVAFTILRGVLSLEEDRVHAFQKNYIKLVSNESMD